MLPLHTMEREETGRLIRIERKRIGLTSFPKPNLDESDPNTTLSLLKRGMSRGFKIGCLQEGILDSSGGIVSWAYLAKI